VISVFSGDRRRPIVDKTSTGTVNFVIRGAGMIAGLLPG